MFINKKKKWSRKNTINFLEKLEMYISANMRIDEALQYCAFGINKNLSKDIFAIKSHVDSGASLSIGISKEVDIRESILSIIRIGERTGKMKESMLVAIGLLEREDELVRKIVSAMTYPILIGIFSLFLLIGLVRGVIPQIVPMLTSLHVKLPLLTRVVILFSEIIKNYGLYIVAVSVIFSLLSIFLYRKSYIVRLCIHIFITRSPLLGKIIKDISFSIFMRSLGSMLVSGIRIQQAYIFSVNGVTLLTLKKALVLNIENISTGKKVSDIFSSSKIAIPDFASGLILAGEKSGTLGLSMIRVADIIDRDIDHTLKRLTSIVEPVLMVSLGFSIGAIALSIIMPIYDISKSLQST